MKKCISLLSFLLFTSLTFGNGISVSGVNFNSSTNQLSFTLTWENSWTYFSGTPNLFDAAWVFIKYSPNGGDTWHHAEILDSVPLAGYNQIISYDDLGIMIYKLDTGTGTLGPEEFTLELAPLLGGYQDFKVFASEMVYLDIGSFYAGDVVSPGRFYQDGNTATPLYIQSENALTRGATIGTFHQEGSTSTQDISTNFPKGYESSFCMKYKITAQQYVDFLNCLTRTQQDNRVKADLSGEIASNKYVMTNTSSVQDRNPIACDINIGTGPIQFFLDLDSSNPPNSSNDGANIVLNHISPADIIAYLDWAGLRPMTELEYEKICRGLDIPPVPNEYAWGTDTKNGAGTIINSGTASESTSNVGTSSSLFKLEPLRAGYSATSSSNRTESCATFWGIMDIHNLGEFMYGVESFNFKHSSYGDGNLDIYGNADVIDWTNGGQLLNTMDSSNPSIEAISKGKTIINANTRSAYMGARGIRRLIQP